MEKLLFGLLTKDKNDKLQELVLCPGWDDELFPYKLEEKTTTINAVIYTRFSSARVAERFLEYERKKGVQYCELQGYNMLVMMDSIGKDSIKEDPAMNKIMELAEKGLIDVVVFPTVSGLAGHLEELFWVLDKLYMYGVKVDWVACGNLDKVIFRTYIEETEKQEQEFKLMLKNFVCQSGIQGEEK